VFAAIQKRFGPSAAYVAVGDGQEERNAAEIMEWPFVQVRVRMSKKSMFLMVNHFTSASSGA